MMQNDPRIMSRVRISSSLSGLNKVVNPEDKYILRELSAHIDALHGLLEWIAKGDAPADRILLDQMVQEFLNQIDPPPPAQTISAARLDGKVRL